MSEQQSAGEHGAFEVRTVNASVNAENKIHDDAVAQRYGFAGGLVPGTMVYAHLTRPFVAAHGLTWFEHCVSELALLKPAYHGDRVRVTATGEPPASAEAHVLGREENAELIARLESGLVDTLPPLHAQADLKPAPGGERVPIGWDALQVDVPLQALSWRPTIDDHIRWTEAASDPLPLYRESGGPVHPGLVLQAANNVFTHHFEVPAWIHTSSRIVQRAPIRINDWVQVRAVPLEKWEHKGHQFMNLYVVMHTSAGPAVEVYHEAIFAPRPRE